VKAVTAQLRAGDRLIVIADNCTDDTAEIARGLGATVLARSDPERRGKGYALEFGRKFLDANPGEVVIIVDADCSPAPHALTRLAITAARRHAVVQGAYLLVPPTDATAIVRVSCFAFLVKNLVRQLALRKLAGTALLQGSGMAFPWSIFRRVEWCSASLVEDLEMGLNLLLGGNTLVFDDAAIFSSDASSQGGTAGQRRRWEHGMLQSMASFVPRLIGAGLGGRARLLFVALDLMIPPTVLLIITAAIATAVSLAVAGFASPVIILLMSELALVAGLGAAWLKHGRLVLPLRSIGDVMGYMFWKLPILAQFVTSRQRLWTRTEREP
jgi:cellulose synthase/poly-beta-1,6-N-acetylglucosamine synthase-like glycosyltransferase